jgi:hypothetical protein
MKIDVRPKGETYIYIYIKVMLIISIYVKWFIWILKNSNSNFVTFRNSKYVSKS